MAVQGIKDDTSKPLPDDSAQLRSDLLVIHQEIERWARSGTLEWDERSRWRAVLARTKKALGL